VPLSALQACVLPGVGKGPQGRGSIIFDHEGALCTDSRYHRYCRGRWPGVLSKGFGPDGKRRRYKVSGRTRQDVIEAQKKKTEELDAGLSTSRSYTASRAAYDWLEHGLPIGVVVRPYACSLGVYVTTAAAIVGRSPPEPSPPWSTPMTRSAFHVSRLERPPLAHRGRLARRSFGESVHAGRLVGPVQWTCAFTGSRNCREPGRDQSRYPCDPCEFVTREEMSWVSAAGMRFLGMPSVGSSVNSPVPSSWRLFPTG
jgi:hypothetical protein